ncbi:MAG: hypothetical protein LBH15_01985 [Treponema sp.]|jgi:hypothetical protein|nr:hypothetical protein [Treponema sp.]
MTLLTLPALPANNAAPPDRPASVVTAGKKSAVLLSPLEVQTDILHLPPLPQKQREKAVRRELRSRYPGNADTACVEYFFLPQNRKKTAGRTRPLAAFTAGPETGLRLREARGPVLPGLAFLLAGRRCAGKDSDLALLLTPEWIEAASFSGGELADYSAAGITGIKSSGPPLEFLEGPRSKTGTEDRRVTIILKDTDENADCVQSLRRHFADHRITGIGDLWDKVSIRRYAVFRRKTAGPNKKAAVLLLAFYGVFLFLALALATARAEKSAARLGRNYDELKARHDENGRLLAEIEALENPGAERGKAGPPDPYAVIAEIHRRIRGANFRSITIQGERFSFEAEARDALSLFRELEQSPRFTGVTLHQTAPASADSELFSVSGRVLHE